MKHKIVALVLVVGLCGQAEAVTGAGARSCGSWITEKNNPTMGGWAKLAQETWLVGFLSGLAAGTGKDILKNTDNESLFLWMNNYCQANPLSDTWDGGWDLFIDLKKKKGF